MRPIFDRLFALEWRSESHVTSTSFHNCDLKKVYTQHVYGSPFSTWRIAANGLQQKWIAMKQVSACSTMRWVAESYSFIVFSELYGATASCKIKMLSLFSVPINSKRKRFYSVYTSYRIVYTAYTWHTLVLLLSWVPRPIMIRWRLIECYKKLVQRHWTGY